jgi:hypothetical protein
MTGEIEMVVSPDDMDDNTFAAHMNYRHGGSLGGLPKLAFSAGCAPGLVAAWRAFHRRLHMLALPGQIAHDHDDHRVASRR